MRNRRFFMVYDFETDGLIDNKRDKYQLTAAEVNPVELAACVIDPRKLDVVAEFDIKMRPHDIDEDGYFERHESTIGWHADLHKCTPEDIMDKWRSYPAPEGSWENFMTFCDRFHCTKGNGTWYTEPLACGNNIRKFDNPIAEEVHKRCAPGKKFPMGTEFIIDIKEMMFMWFENLSEPANFKMDTLRPWLEIPSHGGAHTAIVDVQETAMIIIKFLKFMRRQARVDKFKGGMKNDVYPLRATANA